MNLHFLNVNGDGSQDDIKDMAMSAVARSIARKSAVVAHCERITKELEKYNEAYGKRQGGEDHDPFSRLLIETEAHLLLLVRSHNMLAAKAIEDGKTEVAYAIADYSGQVQAALHIIQQVPLPR